uniref:Uncharacterized protein n=1 Tax=Chromera velia CCMP2878 TaxID=1169474 RepID=A0A0G4G1D1_9ALVE|eukprot:Cvel_19737.t1-p1 / transcript=Cvel_19737.t1 / gene=Cvel_19737 / organism=Chromera_velia_CCMP2878 / gene_product=hypothetical protein / transcript_product=hypothetical protein / location=Cvel_scaffold1726:26426-26869(-) / protein_length=148 / sequence_SO=supercontig / SO=protein_coding / is_pseudo=false
MSVAQAPPYGHAHPSYPQYTVPTRQTLQQMNVGRRSASSEQGGKLPSCLAFLFPCVAVASFVAGITLWFLDPTGSKTGVNWTAFVLLGGIGTILSILAIAQNWKECGKCCKDCASDASSCCSSSCCEFGCCDGKEDKKGDEKAQFVVY